jgi:class 3 adenylate cyclase/tetratricopeptide (TPR) repeat protein
MKCPKCQSDNPTESNFCIECGAPMEAHCPKCGAITPAAGKFCKKCGADLRESKPSPAIDYSQPISYTPKHLADKILSSRSLMEGERKQVTVLFADVKGFTSISEKLDPEEVQNLISECLGFFTEEIHRYEGTIAQFLGDGVMALFGAPIAHEDAPQRALYAALAIRECLVEYSAKLKKDGIDFKMRIGLNTGLVVVGKIGDDLTMEYTAMGDTVNLASRMESAAQPGTIQVSENTHRLTEGYFDFKPLGEIEVKGKKEPVRAYQLLDVGHARTRLGVAEMRGLTPFVGRQKELGQLMECYERAQKGQGQVVGIVGEPGVGKSRLLLHLRAMLPQGEHIYLEGHCLHYGGSMAFLPFLDVLRSYFDIKEGEREYIIKKKLAGKVSQLDEKLKDILPPLEDILSLKVEDQDYLNLEPALKRGRIFESIRDLLVRESQNRLLVLSVEDLHWIDKSSEEFLGYLIGGLATAHILLLILYRPEYTHRWGSKTYYTQIRVDELSLETSAEMVQAILKEGKAAPDLTKLILDKAAGNPLFMEEFTHSLIERGYIERKNGHYVLNIKPSEIQVPDTIQGIIAARIDRLEENLKRTMQVASVIGRDFAYPILQTITGTQRELKSLLVNLQELEFIYEKSLFPELEYTFKHALTQEVAYNGLLLKRRKEIHDRIGKAIEELYPDRLEEFYEMLAHHYSRAENMEKAYQYLRLSSIKAALRDATSESLRLGGEAIDVLKRMPDTEENKRRSVEMRLLISVPFAIQAFPGDALQIMEEGARLAEELGDNRSLVKLWGNISVYYTVKSDFSRACEFADKAFSSAERTGDVELIATNGLALCAACRFAGKLSRIVEVAPAILDTMERAQMQSRTDLGQYLNVNVYSVILSYYGASLGYLGDFDKGLALCKKACHFAQEAGNIYTSLSYTQHLYSLSLNARGDGKRALEHIEKAIRYAEQAEFVVILWVAPTDLGHAYYLIGDLDAARKHYEERLENFRSTGLALNLSWNYYGLGMLCLDCGDLESARTNIEESLKLSHRQGEKMEEAVSTVALGRLIGKEELSQSAQAEKCILQGIKMLEELKLIPYEAEAYLYLGELYADVGRREKALETLKRAESAFRKMGMEYWLRRTQEVLEKLQG